MEIILKTVIHQPIWTWFQNKFILGIQMVHDTVKGDTIFLKPVFRLQVKYWLGWFHGK
jgi:hypothetical protein